MRPEALIPNNLWSVQCISGNVFSDNGLYKV